MNTYPNAVPITAGDLVREERLLSLPEVSIWLGIPVKTLRRYILTGMPHVRIGKHIRCTRTAVSEWVAGGVDAVA